MDVLAEFQTALDSVSQPILAVGIVVAVAIGLLNLVLLLIVLRGQRRAARAYDAQVETLAAEVRRAPTIAAMAALVIASRQSRTSLAEVERELTELLDRWDEIEALAQDARARLAQLEPEDEAPGSSPSRHSA